MADAAPMEPAPSFRALALQLRCDAINRLPGAEAVAAHIKQTIMRIGRQIRASKNFIGGDLALVVLPEYFLTGFPLGEPIEAWAEKASLDMAGAEYDALGRIAEENRIHLAGNAYERDPHFPGFYFQTSFMIGPDGSIALRYRRLISMFAPSPHDLWPRYLDHYGLDGVFPIARTALGAIAAIASEEILYPELVRCFGLRGAEIILHPTSETGSPETTIKDIAKRARAIENMAYVVSANSAGIAGTDIPAESTDGGSQIVDFVGHLLAIAGPGESMVATAELDLAALRRARRRPGMQNFLARQPYDLYRAGYDDASAQVAGGFLGADGVPIVPARADFLERQRLVIANLADAGVI